MLKGFKLERILNESGVSKTVIMLGTLDGKEGQAIVILARRHFPVEAAACSALVTQATLKETFTNDIYSKFEGRLAAEHSVVNVDVIHPCTAKHIAKFSAQQTAILTETAATYEAVTRPHVEALPRAAVQWVYNILDKSKEAERLIFEDPDPQLGFMLHPDLKWDQSQVEALYCLAIVHRKDLRSLRDLRGEHVQLLRNVHAKACAAIQERFAVPASKLRCYLHYPPSYYHLHVHFVHANHDASFGMAVGKGHVLLDVVSALEVDPAFYSKVALTVAVGEQDPLLRKLQEHTQGLDG